ncbi:MAG TPA: hypothetical protein VG028_09635 [Terriglobia bacterium]|nr:hypothetical protein [Terriglobia bacterium]
MNIERAIEFLVKNQVRMDARFDAKFDRAGKRLERLEHVVAQNNHIVTRLARLGLSLRGDVRRNESDLHRTEKNLAEASENIRKLVERQSETDDKLNALIDIVNQHIRGNGR